MRPSFRSQQLRNVVAFEDAVSVAEVSVLEWWADRNVTQSITVIRHQRVEEFGVIIEKVVVEHFSNGDCMERAAADL